MITILPLWILHVTRLITIKKLLLEWLSPKTITNSPTTTNRVCILWTG